MTSQTSHTKAITQINHKLDHMKQDMSGMMSCKRLKNSSQEFMEIQLMGTGKYA